MIIESNNFKALITEFTNWLTVQRKSSSCILNYPMGLSEYFSYLETVHNIKHINKVEKKHSSLFKQHLQIRTNKCTGFGGIQNQTINGILKGLNSFNKYISECSNSYKYAIKEEYLPVENAKKIVLTEDEMAQLIQATYEPYPFIHSQQAFGQRDRVILYLLYGCGLRLNEARHIDISDIDFINNRILVRKGKRNKQRYVPCTGFMLDEIRAYIQCGRYYFTERHHNILCKKRVFKKPQTSSDEQALLLGITGKRLMSFDARLDYLKSKTMITKDISSHVLRHSYGTHLYHKGMGLHKIQQILGHSSVDTTMIYLHISKELNEYNEAV